MKLTLKKFNVFILFKNLDGTDNVTQYSFNVPVKKLEHYLMEALKSGEVREKES